MNLFDLFVKIGMDTSEVDRGIDSTERKVGGFAQGLEKFAKGAGKVFVGAVTAAGTAVLALGKMGVDYNTQMEGYVTNFEVMLGDAEAAVKKVDELKKFAASTPFSIGDLSKATQTLLAFNVSSEESTDVLRMLGDISLGNADKMQSLTNAFGKINSQGKLTGETLQQMITAGFNPALIITEKTGESMEEFQKRLSQGRVSAEELTDAMATATSEGGQFYQGMEKASQTTAGLISTLKDNAMSLVGEVFQPISESILGDILPSALGYIDQLTSAFQEGGVGGLVTAAGNIIANIISGIVGKLPDLIKTAVNIIRTIGNGLMENAPMIISAAFDIIRVLAETLLNPESITNLVNSVVSIISELATNFASLAPTLIPAFFQAIIALVTALTKPDSIQKIIQAALSIITSLISGLVGAIPDIIAAIPEIIAGIIIGIANGLVDILQAGKDIIKKVIEGLEQSYESLKNAAKAIPGKIKEGIAAAWDSVKNWFNNLWDGLLNRTGHIEIETSSGTSQTAGGMDFVPHDGVMASLHRGEAILTAREAEAWRRGNSNGSGVTIVQNIQTVPQTPIEFADTTAAYFEQARWLMA